MTAPDGREWYDVDDRSGEPYRASYGQGEPGDYDAAGNWAAQRRQFDWRAAGTHGMEGSPSRGGYGGYGPEGGFGGFGRGPDVAADIIGQAHGSHDRLVRQAQSLGRPREGRAFVGANVSPEPGRFTGRGPSGYRRSDQRIEEEVNERLTWHPDIDASDVEVRVANGEVTLEGMVDDRWARRLAEDIVADVPGVVDVHNRLRARTSDHAARRAE